MKVGIYEWVVWAMASLASGAFLMIHWPIGVIGGLCSLRFGWSIAKRPWL